MSLQQAWKETENTGFLALLEIKPQIKSEINSYNALSLSESDRHTWIAYPVWRPKFLCIKQKTNLGSDSWYD